MATVVAVIRRGGAALLLAWGATAPAAAEPAAGAPEVLTTPAVQSRKALGAATLDVTRAGRRLVAVGERGTVLLSDDAGTRWRQAQVPVQTTLTAVRFVDERIGWAVGHLGVILRTDDGGESWHKQLDGLRAAALIVEAARSSGDERAGRDARRFLEEGPDKPFFDLDFADARRGVAVGAYNLAFATADGGANWTPLPLPNPRSLHLYGVRFSGGCVYVVGEQGLLLKSADGVAAFSALPSPYKGSFFGLLAARSGTLIAYGLRGHAFRSTDKGASWEKRETGVPSSIGAALEFGDHMLALLSQTGDLLLSRDDGQSFTKATPDAGPLPATGLAAADAGLLVLASLRGMRQRPAP